MGQRRFDVVLFLLSGAVLAGCGGGRAVAPAESQALPPLVSTPPPSANAPVGYLQSSGPSSTTGTIAAGAHQALIAVMSGAAAPSSYTSDMLTVNTSANPQTAVRAARFTSRTVAPPHVNPVEAFPADDRTLLRKLRALQNGAAGPVRARRRVTASSPSIGSSASIWVERGALSGARANVQVPARLLAQSMHVNLWIDATLQLTQSEISHVDADAENAYASDTEHFASPDYSSGAPGLQPQYSACAPGGARQGTSSAYIQEPADHRIDVMVVNSANLGGLGGYFSAANLMTQATLNCLNGSSQTYESNEAPFIFVGWFARSGAAYDLREDLVRSTAHELQHLINFVNHVILPVGASSPSFNGYEDAYVNEGLSMLAQDLAISAMYGADGVRFDVDDALSRAAVYLAAPSNYSLSAFSGADPVSWGGDGGVQYNCGGGCYGVAYLFQRYLRDRFGGDAYTHAMETSGLTGVENLEYACGESASSLFGDFGLAMAANSLGVTANDSRFVMGSLNLVATYTDQFGASSALDGVSAMPLNGGSLTAAAPVGGFTFVRVDEVPSNGASLSVSDAATASGFSLEGGLAQK